MQSLTSWILLLLILGGLRYLLLLFEEHNLYFPFKKLDTNPSYIKIPYEEIRFPAQDGTTLHAWWVPSPQSRGTLLFCHGNAGNISHRLDKIDLFRSLGLDVFIFDYRGYGQSRGKPSEKGTYADARGAYAYLTLDRKTDPGKIILYGEFLGGAVAIHLAALVPCGALIAEAAFTSTVNLGKEIYPFLPVRWMVRHKYDSLSKISRINAPILILHSRQDEIIPFRHGQALYEAARFPKELAVLKGGHNDAFLASGRDTLDSIRSFLEKHFLK